MGVVRTHGQSEEHFAKMAINSPTPSFRSAGKDESAGKDDWFLDSRICADSASNNRPVFDASSVPCGFDVTPKGSFKRVAAATIHTTIVALVVVLPTTSLI